MRYLLVDTAYLIFRSHFAFASMSKTGGMLDGTSSAFYGFAKNLMSLNDQYKPDQIYFLNDAYSPTWRHKEHSGYKAGRPPADPQMVEQIPIITDWCRVVAPNGYFETPGWEADDLIYTLAIEVVLGQKAPKRKMLIETNQLDKKINDKKEIEIEDLSSFFDTENNLDNSQEIPAPSNFEPQTETHPPSELFEVDFNSFQNEVEQSRDEVLVLSSDRDLYQLLVLPQVKFLKSDKMGNLSLFGTADFIQKYELDPKQWLDYKGLVGDASDNLSGIAGVGPKTATSLLQSVGSLYYLLGAMGIENRLFLKSALINKDSNNWAQKAKEYVDNPKNAKLIQKIRDYQTQLQETYRLSSLQIVPNVDFAPSNINFLSGASFFEKYKFASLLKKLNLGQGGDTQDSLF